MMKVFGNVETGQVEIEIETNGIKTTAKMPPTTAKYYADILKTTAELLEMHKTPKTLDEAVRMERK